MSRERLSTSQTLPIAMFCSCHGYMKQLDGGWDWFFVAVVAIAAAVVVVVVTLFYFIGTPPSWSYMDDKDQASWLLA